MDNNTQLIKVPFAKDPVNLGFYDELVAQGITSFGIMNRVNRYGCEWESLVDNNTDAPAVWDGGDTITPSENWKLNAGNPDAWLMNHDKPATSEQYPFNGMGRIRLQKNLVEVEEGGETVTKNLLTQAMFEDGDGNPLTNTVYVIQYDFTLGEDVTIPADCVLEFDGGSVSGAGTDKNTITGNSTVIAANSHCLLNVILAGTFTNDFIDIEWFGIKSGSSYASYNDSIIQNYIIPSMENIKSILYMSPKIDMTFTIPIVFNGDYDLELKGTLNYTGNDISTAITIGKASEATTNRNYYIYQLVGKAEFILNHTAEPVENVGVCLLNIKLCRITIGTISRFCYCLRLHGSSDGCASNEINVVAINGFYYYGIHILSTDNGWANENKFYCNRITPFSSNPVDTFAIWFDSENSNSCNGNTFISPNIEGNTNGCKCTYAEYNLLLAARVEGVTNILVTDDNENGVSKNNNICANVVWNYSAIKDYGLNHVISFARLSDDKDLLWKDNLSITSTSSTYHGMSLSIRSSSVPDPDNPDERIDMKECKLITSASISGTQSAIGRIVKFIDSRDGTDVATMSIRLSDAARICIVALNSTASGVLTEQVEDPDNPGHTLTVPVHLPDFIESSTIIYGAPVDDYYKRKQENGFFLTSSSTTYINLKIKKKGLYFIGVRPHPNQGVPRCVSFYSDTLEVCNVFEVTNSNRIAINGMDDLDVWNINLIRTTFFDNIKIVDLNKGLDINGRTLPFSDKRINIHLGTDMLRNGTINVDGAMILPDYNKLVAALSSDCNLSGMPAAGTLYWQNGKPTWSNGTQWVDATGTPV